MDLQPEVLLSQPLSLLHFYCLALGWLVLEYLDAKGLNNKWECVTYCRIMEEDVQVLKDVSSRMINIFLKEGLVWTGEAETIEDLN